METLDLGKGLRTAFETGMVRKERVDDTLVAAYVRPFDGVEGRKAYLRCARALCTEDLTSVMDRVERLDVPTLIIWGAADPYQDVRYGERLARAMRRARLVVEEAGHFIQEDRPEEVAFLVRNFVADP
jgi:pimeloyl-ACP methyl ester carboxylesterase